MRIIKWGIPVGAAFAAVMTAYVALAAPGDVLQRVRSADATPDGAQRALIAAALGSCVPDATPADVTEFVCRRTGQGVACRAEEDETLDIADYLALRLKNEARPATSRSGSSVTFTKAFPWASAASQCKSDLATYIVSAHPGTAAANAIYFKSWRESGTVMSHVDTLELISATDYVDAEIAGTAKPIAAVVE